MLDLFSRHRVFTAYCTSLLYLLVASLWFAQQVNKGLGHAPVVAAIFAGVVVLYASIWKALSLVAPCLTNCPSEAHLMTVPSLSRTKSMVLMALTLLFVAVLIAHMVTLSDIPILAALSSSNDISIGVIRQKGYFDLPLWLRYISSYNFKGLGPTLLVIAYLYHKRLFWFVLIMGSLYCLAMFVRIMPFIFLAPLLLLLLFQRRWLHLALTAALLTMLVTVASSASAPSIRSSFLQGGSGGLVTTATEKNWRSESVAYAIFDRALFVPGKVIDQWFDFYSHPEAREHGCGYRILARVMGCNYVPIPSKLYQVFYPERVQSGMHGSLNAASFMNDYANFGPIGIVVSTILTALLFCLVTVIYRNHWLALPMNIPLIVISMETSIITALNSGAGWLVMTALFLYFFRKTSCAPNSA